MEKQTNKRVIEALISGVAPTEAQKLYEGLSQEAQSARTVAIIRKLIAAGKLDPATTKIPDVTGTRDLPYAAAYERLNAALGLSLDPKRKTQPPSTKGRQRTIVLGDLHYPNHSVELLADLTAQFGKGNRLIIAGDLCDFIRLSRHEKRVIPSHKNKEINMTLLGILKGLMGTFAWLGENWDDVEVCFGNHDNRLTNRMVETFGPVDGCEVSAELWNHMVFDHVQNLRSRATELGKGLVIKRGDARIGHFDVSSTIEMRAAVKAYTWVEQHPELEGAKCVVQAHTHQVGDIMHDRVRIVECGSMLGDSPDYVLEQTPKFRYPNLGAFELVQYDGKINNSESRLHFIASEKYWDTTTVEAYLEEAA